MQSSEMDEENLGQNKLKIKLERIAEQDPRAVANFAARCSLRAMPLLAVQGNFDYWPEKDRSRRIFALWASSIVVLNGSAGDSVRSIYTDAQKAVQAAEKAPRAARASGRASMATVAYAADAYTYASYAAYAYLDAFDAFDSVSLAEVCKGAALSDLLFMERGEPPNLSAPLLEGFTNHDTYREHLHRWKDSLEKLSLSQLKPNDFVSKFVNRIPGLFEQILYGTLSDSDIDFHAQAYSKFFIDEANKSSKTGSAKKSKKDTKIPTVEEKNSAYAPEIEAERDVGTLADLDGESDGFEKVRINTDEIKNSNTDVSTSESQSHEATSKEDYLNRMQLVNALAAILADPGNDHHQTLGLLGEWGSGKSTWLGFLNAALINNHPEQPYVFGSFNAWAYEHTENLQAGIAHEMIKTLVAAPSGKNWLSKWWWGWKLKGHVAVALHGWPKMLELFCKFIAAIVPFTILAAVLVPELKEMLETKVAANTVNSTASSASATAVENSNLMTGLLTLGAGFVATLVLIKKSCLEQWKAIWASPEAQKLLTYLKLPDYAKHLGEISEMRKTLEKFSAVRLNKFENKNTRLLFVVDDLDRCSHQCIVKVFEAVRLVLDIPNVIVVIAVDQHIALAALALHYKDLAQHHKLGSARAIARDYLAKVIHLPIMLNRPAPQDVENYLKKIWANSAPEIHPALEEALPAGLTTPAQHLMDTKLSGQSTASLQRRQPSNPFESPSEIAGNAATNELSQSALTQTDHPPQSTPEQTAEIKPPTIVKGLTFGQKDAFIYWATYFDLTNPRQLKRLNNTYSLLLNAYPTWDKKSSEVEFNQKENKIFYPILITLVTLEYLNALDDPALRKRLKARLKSKEEGEGHELISPAFLALFVALERDAELPLMKTLEPFVLPAIECEERPTAASETV